MSIAFTPILPYPATDYDIIHTRLFNFEDVLMQKNKNMEHYGAKGFSVLLKSCSFCMLRQN